MFLSKIEEKILEGEKGWVLARAMKLLVTLGELGGAEKFVPIRKSQVAGVSYKTSGDATLELIEHLTQTNPKVKVKTLATLNPAGMDLERYGEMGIPPYFAEKQLRICTAYQRLGIKPYCTCTPYLSGNCPLLGEVVGFSESSAVAYVNSVIGARTHRHGGLDALSAALVGKTPQMGLLLEKNRLGDIKIIVNCEMRSESDYSALGYFIGKKLKTGKIPVYEGVKGITLAQLKLLGAASAASGSVALYHVDGVTPEARRWKKIYRNDGPSDTIWFGETELKSVYDELSSPCEVDLVAIGCPHCSLKEIKDVASLLKGKRVKKKIRFWVFTSPMVYHTAEKKGYIKLIKEAGGDVFKHTCMVVMPIEEMGIECIAVNSAKAAFYVPRTTNHKCHATLMSMNDMKSFLD